MFANRLLRGEGGSIELCAALHPALMSGGLLGLQPILGSCSLASKQHRGLFRQQGGAQGKGHARFKACRGLLV